MTSFEEIQQQHYDEIGDRYSAHYGDPWSQRYRRRNIIEPMLWGLDLCGAKVVDAFCGAGETTAHLLKRGVSVTGVDISEKMMRLYRWRHPGCASSRASMLDTGLEGSAYDCVMAVGGLHHLQPDVPAGLQEIHRILKPGGYLCFKEPHKGSVADLVRRAWYAVDPFFAENESALDLPALKSEFSGKFEFVKESYGGNVAYLLVYSSMILRIPLSWKRYYAPFLFGLEDLIEMFQGPLLSCFAICQWRKI